MWKWLSGHYWKINFQDREKAYTIYSFLWFYCFRKLLAFFKRLRRRGRATSSHTTSQPHSRETTNKPTRTTTSSTTTSSRTLGHWSRQARPHSLNRSNLLRQLPTSLIYSRTLCPWVCHRRSMLTTQRRRRWSMESSKNWGKPQLLSMSESNEYRG